MAFKWFEKIIRGKKWEISVFKDGVNLTKMSLYCKESEVEDVRWIVSNVLYGLKATFFIREVKE